MQSQSVFSYENMYFCHLPDECLQHIFHYVHADINGREDLRKIAQVCCRFQAIAQEFNPKFSLDQSKQQKKLDIDLVEKIIQSYFPLSSKVEYIDHIFEDFQLANVVKNLPLDKHQNLKRLYREDLLLTVIKFKSFGIVDYLLNKQEFKEDLNSYSVILNYACTQGWLKVVTYCLEQKQLDPSFNDCKALITACRAGHLEVVKQLTEAHYFTNQTKQNFIDPSQHLTSIQEALTAASTNGHIEIVRHLISKYKLNIEDALFAACNRYVEIVDLLLKYQSSQKINNVTKIYSRVIISDQKTVAQLLITDPRFDPSLNNSDIVRHAGANLKLDIMQILLKHKRTSPWCVPSEILSIPSKIKITLLHLLPFT